MNKNVKKNKQKQNLKTNKQFYNFQDIRLR